MEKYVGSVCLRGCPTFLVLETQVSASGQQLFLGVSGFERVWNKGLVTLLAQFHFSVRWLPICGQFSSTEQPREPVDGHENGQ